MLKAIKIRLYPNKDQQIYINKLLGSYRFVYNKCLELKKEKYLEDKSNLALKELGYYFHNKLTKTEEFNWLNDHNTKVLKQSILNLMEAYKRFFINGNGFPKFKSKSDNILSCRFPVDAISNRNNYLSNKLTLTKELKNVRFKTSKEYKQQLANNKENIKSATLTKTKTGKYFLNILIDSKEIKVFKKPINEIIGIDLGIKDFVVTSEGEIFKNIKPARNNQKKISKLQKQLSKKKNGSNNKNKARIKLALFHEKLNNIKENYLHQVSNSLLNDSQVIVMENLNVLGMLKNHNLARSIQELSLGRFKEILKYKSEWSNRQIIEIDRFYPSSKLCNVCGYKYKTLNLSERSWVCPVCKTVHDRDLNAAINIRNEGIRILGDSNRDLPINKQIGSRRAEFTLVDNPTKGSSNTFMDDKEEIPLRSSGWLKQEEGLKLNL